MLAHATYLARNMAIPGPRAVVRRTKLHFPFLFRLVPTYWKQNSVQLRPVNALVICRFGIHLVLSIAFRRASGPTAAYFCAQIMCTVVTHEAYALLASSTNLWLTSQEDLLAHAFILETCDACFASIFRLSIKRTHHIRSVCNPRGGLAHSLRAAGWPYLRDFFYV